MIYSWDNGQIITFLPFIKQKAHAHYRPKHWIDFHDGAVSDL